MTTYMTLQTSLGSLLLVSNQSELTGLTFDGARLPEPGWKLEPRHPVLSKAAEEVAEYLDGRRSGFSIPFSLAGTEFQKRIWSEIARIPYGETITYGELACRAGHPRAVRAVGASTGRNPVGIIIPCHRVVGKDGSLTGFAGGLQWKRHLLAIEQRSRGAGMFEFTGAIRPISSGY